jgi:hypothetical protein
MPSFAGHIGRITTPAIRPDSSSTPIRSRTKTGKAKRAIRANNRFARQLGWLEYFDDIVRVLGFSTYSPGPTEFARAVAKWQRDNNLRPDGIIGPTTWARLSSLVPAAHVSPAQLRNNIVQIANTQWETWGRGSTKETNPRILATLQDYWRFGVGRRFAKEELASKAFQSERPWSAAFVSWVVKKAGGGPAFRYSGAHANYIHAAKQNRLASSSNPFKAYRITEIRPRPGDIVAKARAGSGATYDNIRPGFKTHGDIVTEVGPKWIKAIGGNVSDSVRRKTLRTDENGNLNHPGYFVIIRVGP